MLNFFKKNFYKLAVLFFGGFLILPAISHGAVFGSFVRQNTPNGYLLRADGYLYEMANNQIPAGTFYFSLAEPAQFFQVLLDGWTWTSFPITNEGNGYYSITTAGFSLVGNNAYRVILLTNDNSSVGDASKELSSINTLDLLDSLPTPPEPPAPEGGGGSSITFSTSTADGILAGISNSIKDSGMLSILALIIGFNAVWVIIRFIISLFPEPKKK